MENNWQKCFCAHLTNGLPRWTDGWMHACSTCFDTAKVEFTSAVLADEFLIFRYRIIETNPHFSLSIWSWSSCCPAAIFCWIYPLFGNWNCLKNKPMQAWKPCHCSSSCSPPMCPPFFVVLLNHPVCIFSSASFSIYLHLSVSLSSISVLFPLWVSEEHVPSNQRCFLVFIVVPIHLIRWAGVGWTRQHAKHYTKMIQNASNATQRWRKEVNKLCHSIEKYRKRIIPTWS